MQVTKNIECFDDAEKALVYLKKVCSSDTLDENVTDLIFLDIKKYVHPQNLISDLFIL